MSLPHLNITEPVADALWKVRYGDGQALGGGFWIDDYFLWKVLPRLTPLATHVYVLLGRYATIGQYPNIKDLGIELERSVEHIELAIMKLKACRLLTDADVRKLIPLK